MSGFIVPAFAERHNDPIARQFIQVAHRLFTHRWDLAADVVKDGAIVLPGFPELLLKPPKRGEDESTESYERRRADGMQSILAVLTTLVACCDWTDHTVRDPRGGYLSAARLAELAGLPVVDGEPTDRTERALAVLRLAKVITFTKQHRERKADGKCKSTGPALRRLGRWFFLRLGEVTTDVYRRRVEKMKRRKELSDRDAERARRSNEQTRATVRGIVNASESRAALRPDSPSSPPALAGRSDRIAALVDQMKAAHPEWSTQALFAEARRLVDSS